MKRIVCYGLFWALFAFFLLHTKQLGLAVLDASKKPRAKSTIEAKGMATATKAPAIKRPLSEGEFDLILAKSPWPKKLHGVVKRVAFCESSWIPTAKGPTDDHGLMQVRFTNHAEKVDAAEDLYDPHLNLAVAHAVFTEAKRGTFKHGFAPWYMSNKCHGAVPAKVAARIKQFRAKKLLLAKAP